MAVSTANITGPALRYTIITNGSTLNSNYLIDSITVKHSLNKISRAKIAFAGSETSNNNFQISESNELIPGSSVSIMAAYGTDSESTIFTGVVVKQSLEINNNGKQFIVTCKHQAVAMTFNRAEGVFLNQTDSDIMTAILKNYSAFSSTVTASSYTQEMIYQKIATDWDFIVLRSNFLGYVIALDGSSITIGPPTLSGSAPLKVTYGSDIITFKAEIDAQRQPASVQTNSWDISALSTVNATSTEPTINKQGNLSGTALASSLGQQTLNLNSGTATAEDGLKLLANASLLKMRLSAIRGEVTFAGSALAKTNTLLTLIGVGERFDGDAFVSAVIHTLKDGVWQTTAKFGLDDASLHAHKPSSYSSFFDLPQAINGLQIGIVKQLAFDPNTQFPVEVTIVSASKSPVALWARVAASSTFIPEIGNKVIIGYLEDDPRYPVILGSLHTGTNTNPGSALQDTNVKMQMTGAPVAFKFDDENKVVTIQTPAGNQIVMSDQDKAISVTDQNGNSIKMTPTNITIDSAKDITLSASGNISLDATGRISLIAKQDITAVSDMNITHSADIGFTGKGNATAELSATGQTTIKGGIVMIN